MFSIPLFAYGKRFFSFTLHKDFRSHRSRFRLRYCKGLWILHRLHLLLQLMPHRTQYSIHWYMARLPRSQADTVSYEQALPKAVW